MPKITFVEADGTRREIDASTGDSVMRNAVNNGIAGIVAMCGGACACATCHVFVDPAWIARIGPADDGEDAMLFFATGRRDNSRLSCQIEVTDALDGLVLYVPEEQG